MYNLTTEEFNLLIKIMAILATVSFVIAVYLLIREIFKNHNDYKN